MRRIFPLVLLFGMLAGCGMAANKTNRAEAYYLLGVSYLQEQNPTLALKEFLQAEQINADDADLQAALGQAYQLKKAYPEAEAHYLRSLKLSRDNPQVQNNLGALYLDMQRWDQAIRYFRLASGNLLFTRQVVALTGLGYAYYQKGDYLEAVSAFKNALAQDPHYAQAHLMLGETYVALDKNELAITEFRQALKAAPDYARAQYDLGLAFRRQGDNAKAMEAFREVVRLAPDSEFGAKAADYLKLLH